MKARNVLTAVVLTLLACDVPVADHERSGPNAEVELTGTLSLNLLSADSSGRTYRLRNATFGVSRSWPDVWAPEVDAGPFGITLSSESDLNAPVLTVKLTPGYYEVALASGGWYLERSAASGGWQRVQQAVLLSPPAQSAYVADGGVSSVNYRFGVDGELIDFRAGDLQIGISIERPGEGAPDAGWFGGTGGLTGGFGGTTGGGTFY